MSALIPPSARSHAALGLTAAAAVGRFELQVCSHCGTVQYPPREACVKCLSSELTWREHSGRGELIAATAIHHSHHPYFRRHTPWNIGMVRLDGGITVIAHLHHACVDSREGVRVRALLDRGGRGVLFAFPTDAARAAEADLQVLEMTCTPKQKRALVTDGTSELGEALVASLLAAGAGLVWAGTPAGAKPRFAAGPEVVAVPLDITDAESVDAAAAKLGSQVDIIIHNAKLNGGPAALHSRSIELAQAEMNTNYLGLMRLTTAFVPHFLARAHEKVSRPTAWVNVLSIYAHSNLPSHGTYSASKAAALSLAQCLRAQLRSSGIRVLNMFPGPIDEAAFRDVPQPKLPPAVLARAIVEALDSGQEDCYPGDVAQDFLRRWRQDPKVIERQAQDSP
jgi:NAD(P)-dependent dehydrogenase (short-subunit alcohol dehydrogenase family)/uncharacterized OB-fold protein